MGDSNNASTPLEEESNPSKIYVIGIKFMRTGEFESACPYLEKWIEFRGEHTDPGDYRNLGWCYLNLKRYEEAYTMYDRAKVLYLRVTEDRDGYLQRRIFDCRRRLDEIADIMKG